MDDDVALADTVAERDRLGPLPVHPDSLVAVLAEDERLAVFEHQLMVGLDLLVAHVVEGAVIENVAVLKDFDERRAAMPMSAFERIAEVLLLDIDRTRNERRMRSQSHRQRIKRKVHRAEWRRLRDLANFRRRRVLPLGQAVNP